MRKFIFILVVIGLCQIAKAQQLPTSNLYTTDMYRINPAYAGATGCVQGYLGHLSQYTGINGGPKTSYIEAHLPVYNTMGVGMRVLLDNTPMIDKTSVLLSYAYGVKIGEEHNIRFGLSGGFSQVKLDFSSAIVSDVTDDIITGGIQKSMAFNNDFGIYYTYKKLYAGLSIPQIAEANANYDINASKHSFKLNRHYITFVGTDLAIDDVWSIQPSLLYKISTLNNTQLDLNGQVSYQNLVYAGLGYRTNRGLLVRLGVNIKDIYNLNYAYAAASNDKLAGVSKGSHEILLGIRFCKGEPSLQDKIIAEEEALKREEERASFVQDSIVKHQALEIVEAIQDSVAHSTNTAYEEAMAKGDLAFFSGVDLGESRLLYEKAAAINPDRPEARERITYIKAELQRQELQRDLSNRDNLVIEDKGQDAYVAAKSAADIAKSAAYAAARAAKVAATAATAATESANAVAKVKSPSAKIAAAAAQKAAKQATQAASIATEAAAEASSSATESSIAANAADGSGELTVTLAAVEKAVKASEEALQAASIATAAAMEATNAAAAAKLVAKSAHEVAAAGVKEENAAAARAAAQKAVEAAELTESIVKDIRAKIEYLKANPYDINKGKTFESKKETYDQRKSRLLATIDEKELKQFDVEITFPLGGGIPHDGFMTKMDKLANILIENPELNLHVVGHSCDIGEEHVRRVIAEVRSLYITRYLMFKGISPERIKTRGASNLQPKVKGETEEARAVNRRVEFIVE